MNYITFVRQHQEVYMNQEKNPMYNDPEIERVIGRYQEMLKSGSVVFFDVHEYGLLIEHFIQNGELEIAMSIATNAMHQYPVSGELKLKQAQILIDKNKCEEALVLLKSIEPYESCNSEYFLLKGIAENFLNMKEMALYSFAKAMENADDQVADIYFSIAISYENAGEYDTAIPYLHKAYEEIGENTNVIFELAFSYDKTEQLDKAIYFYNKYLDIDPFAEIVWFNLGVVFSRYLLFDKAVEAFDYVLAINEDYPLALFNKGNAYANMGNYAEAIKAYEAYLEFENDNVETMAFIGECYERLGDFKLALDYYQQALLIDPDYADAIYGIGILHSICENFQDSFLSIQRAIEINPENADYWFSLGNVNAKLERPDEAIAAYNRAISLDPQDYESWLNLSELYLKKKLLSKAIKILEDAYKANSEVALINYRLAAYNLLKHNFDEGIKYFRRGIYNCFDEHNEVFKYYPEAVQIKEIEQIIKHFNPIQS